MKTYTIRTFGCQMNVHDSERLAGQLEQAGYRPADEQGARRPGPRCATRLGLPARVVSTTANPRQPIGQICFKIDRPRANMTARGGLDEGIFA